MDRGHPHASTRALFASLTFCLVAACTSPRTEVIVVTDTDMRGTGGLDQMTIEVMTPDGRPMQTSIARIGAGEPALPRTLGLVWDAGPLGPFVVRASGQTAGATRVERTARFTFQQGRTLVLRMDLLARCAGVSCGADTTCAESGCRSIDIGMSELLPWTGTAPGLDGSVPAEAGPSDGGVDSGPPGCSEDRHCVSLDRPCARGTCDLATRACVSTPRAEGTACDDGMFCTTGDLCTAGACTGAAVDCSAMTDACNVGTCDEAADACARVAVADGRACEDGMFCTTAETCTGGVCGGGVAMTCDDTSPCTADACDETGDLCVNDPSPLEGMACDDGLFCGVGESCTAGVCAGATPRACDDALFCTGTETCDEAADACASSGVPCGDAFTCTVEACAEAGSTCTSTRSEPACAAGQICSPVAYATTASGCGAAPTTISVACPAAGSAGAPSSCTATLSAGAVVVPGEESRITCTARPAPVVLFSDDFTGGLDAAWVTSAGAPRTDSVLGNEAAAATVSWQADAPVAVAGLATTCVDFRVAQANAGAGERIRWDVSFDGGAFATVFDLDFGTWEVGTQTYAFNREACTAVPAAASTALFRLRMDSNTPAIWVDDVVVSGIATPFTAPAGGGPDDFSVATGWTFTGGTAPYVGVQGGSSAMFAELETFTATRAAIDASACDVLDVDFDFGYAPGATTLDMGDALRLEAAVSGGAFSVIELVDLQNGEWNQDSLRLPWLGLRRLTDRFPAAAGASTVALRFVMSADNAGERVWVDDFAVRCADLTTPTVSAVTDAGAGSYTFDVLSASPLQAIVTCTFQTTNDGPLTGTDAVQLLP